MDPKAIDKLEKLGALQDLGNGRKGVPVSLQYEARLDEPSRPLRRDILRREFARVEQELALQGARVDLGTISISGQTVDAVLPADAIDVIESTLKARHIRVDAAIDRKIV